MNIQNRFNVLFQYAEFQACWKWYNWNRRKNRNLTPVD